MNYLQRKKYALRKSKKGNFKGYLTSVNGEGGVLTVPKAMNSSPTKIIITGRSYRVNEGDNELNIFDFWDNPTAWIWGQYKYKYIKVKPNTLYTLSTNTPLTIDKGNGKQISVTYMFSGKNLTYWYYAKTLAGAVYDGSPKTVCSDQNGYLTIMILGNRDISDDSILRKDLENETYWFMLNEGSSALEYKPYKSDSANPKEIQNCGDKIEDLDGIESYVIPLEQYGNLFNIHDRQNIDKHYTIDDDDYIYMEWDNTVGTEYRYPSYYTYPCKYLKPNRMYTIVAEVAQLENCYLIVMSHGDSYEYSTGQFEYGKGQSTTGTHYCYTISKDSFSECETFLRTEVQVISGKFSKAKFRLSVYEGILSTPAEDFVYSPYKDNFNSVNIYTPVPIMGGISGSSNADRFGDDIVIDIKNRKATLNKNFNKVIFDGSLHSSTGYKFWNTQEYSKVSHTFARFRLRGDMSGFKTKAYGAAISNYFKRDRYVWSNIIEAICCIGGDSSQPEKGGSMDITILLSTIAPYYSIEDGTMGTEETIAAFYEIINAETEGEKASTTYIKAASKAFNNWLIAMNEQGNPLTIWYEPNPDKLEGETIDISDLQDWDSIEKFVLSRGTNTIIGETNVNPIDIKFEYYNDTYIPESTT